MLKKSKLHDGRLIDRKHCKNSLLSCTFLCTVVFNEKKQENSYCMKAIEARLKPVLKFIESTEIYKRFIPFPRPRKKYLKNTRLYKKKRSNYKMAEA